MKKLAHLWCISLCLGIILPLRAFFEITVIPLIRRSQGNTLGFRPLARVVRSEAVCASKIYPSGEF